MAYPPIIALRVLLDVLTTGNACAENPSGGVSAAMLKITRGMENAALYPQQFLGDKIYFFVANAQWQYNMAISEGSEGFNLVPRACFARGLPAAHWHRQPIHWPHFTLSVRGLWRL